MSVYDLFNQTQFLFIPSPQDNWSDPHFYIKTFGPGIITACFTGTIAILAYRVARSQRKIAANKYNLDLFDKRYEVYSRIIKLKRELTKDDIILTANFKFLVSSHKEAILSFDKMPLLFDNIEKSFHDKLYKELLECEYVFRETSSFDMKRKKNFLFSGYYGQDEEEIKKIREDHDKEMQESYDERKEFFDKYMKNLNNLIKQMEEKLVISHKPY